MRFPNDGGKLRIRARTVKVRAADDLREKVTEHCHCGSCLSAGAGTPNSRETRPHAAELFSYSHSMASEIFANLDVEMLEMLRAEMSKDAELAPTAVQLARALYFGSAALAGKSETTAQMELELGAFARAHVAGARALARASLI